MQPASTPTAVHWRVMAAKMMPTAMGPLKQRTPTEGLLSSMAPIQATAMVTTKDAMMLAVETIGAHIPKPVNNAAIPAPASRAITIQPRPQLRVVRIDASTASRLSPVRCSLCAVGERRVCEYNGEFIRPPSSGEALRVDMVDSLCVLRTISVAADYRQKAWKAICPCSLGNLLPASHNGPLMLALQLKSRRKCHAGSGAPRMWAWRG